MSAAADLVVAGARLRGAEGSVDVVMREGKIAAVDVGAAAGVQAANRVDAHGGLLVPSFVEPHFHLDKCLSRDRFGAVNPQEAFARARDVKAQFTVEDVEERACRALRLAVAHGIGHMRAQCDIDFAARLVSFEGLLRARERFRGLIDVEIVAFPQEGIVTDPEAPALLREALAAGADAVGGLPEFERSVADQSRHIETVLELAAEFGVPADLHTDYFDSPDLRTLEMLADRVLAGNFTGSVVAAHCCALAVYPDDEAARVIDKVARAGIQVTIMPIANLEMLGGPARTPRNRGSSRAKELLDAGVNVASALDNMYDIWYRFSRMDPVELASMTVHSCGMRTDAEVETAFDMVTTRAAQVVGGAARRVEPGEAADLVLFEATSVVDVIRNVPGRRVAIKAGRVVGGIEGSCWAAA